VSRLTKPADRFEVPSFVFMLLGVASYCERLDEALRPHPEARSSRPPIDDEHPALLVALGLETFGRSVATLLGPRLPPSTKARDRRATSTPADRPGSFRQILR
jgi:hypothetical protein